MLLRSAYDTIKLINYVILRNRERGVKVVKKETRTVVLSALFLALGLCLPFLTGQMKELGDSLLPMHLPVLLCGLFCGPFWGGSVGFILPFLRSVLFGMPPIYPQAVWMALELMTYGFVIGFLYRRFRNPGTGKLYLCLISAMLSGRVVWGIAKALLLGLAGKGFTFYAFWVGGFADALPGILLQLVLIPLIMGLYGIYKGGNSQ